LINSQSYKWFFETTTPFEGHMHAIARTLVEAQTKFQHVEIFQTAAYGKTLVLDGRIQSSQVDEFIYHEALVHPGMLTAEAAPRSALVIGGGEGATLREILRYPAVTRAVMVDIDQEVVELCKSHLPEMHRGAFDDPRTEVRHEDARAYLEQTKDRFDMITVDLDDVPEARVGSPVVLWGEGLPVDEVANAASTVGYELLCAVAPRVRFVTTKVGALDLEL